jgi:hypothetical protein
MAIARWTVAILRTAGCFMKLGDRGEFNKSSHVPLNSQQIKPAAFFFPFGAVDRHT